MCRDILSTMGVFSTMGDIMSTVRGVQYHGGTNLLLFEYPHNTHDIPPLAS